MKRFGQPPPRRQARLRHRAHRLRLRRRSRRYRPRGGAKRPSTPPGARRGGGVAASNAASAPCSPARRKRDGSTRTATNGPTGQPSSNHRVRAATPLARLEEAVARLVVLDAELRALARKRSAPRPGCGKVARIDAKLDAHISSTRWVLGLLVALQVMMAARLFGVLRSGARRPNPPRGRRAAGERARPEARSVICVRPRPASASRPRTRVRERGRNPFRYRRRTAGGAAMCRHRLPAAAAARKPSVRRYAPRDSPLTGRTEYANMAGSWWTCR